MARHKNTNWNLPDKCGSWEQASAAILMDIREELQALNRLLNCHNFTQIPYVLRCIREKLPAKKRRKKK